MLVDSIPVAMSLHIHDDCVIPSSTCVQGNSTTAFVALSCTRLWAGLALVSETNDEEHCPFMEHTTGNI